MQSFVRTISISTEVFLRYLSEFQESRRFEAARSKKYGGEESRAVEKNIS
jgi:hypothetical protein